MLSTDTVVRTSNGPKAVGQLKKGDKIYDENDELVECTSIGDPETSELKEVEYTEFARSFKVSFKCSPSHQLYFKPSAVHPHIYPEGKKFVVEWFSKCIKENRQEIENSCYVPPELAIQLEKRGLADNLKIGRTQRFCKKNGECKAFKKDKFRFKDQDNARFVYSLLLSRYYYLVDPFMVTDDDEFIITPLEFGNMCTKTVLNDKLIKLSRCPLRFVPSDNPVSWRDLPIDPHLLGLWLGDGCKHGMIITGSNRNDIHSLDVIVEELNSRMNPADGYFYLSEFTSSKPFDRRKYMGREIRSNVNSYQIRISFHCRRKKDNELLTALRNFGLLGDKTNGVPDVYKRASESVRLKILAGLIDSGGTRSRAQNHYEFMQAGHEHKKLVYDVNELALSCGIQTSGVKGPFFRKQGKLPVYRVILTEGSDKISQYLCVAHKKKDMEKYENRLNINLSTSIKISPSTTGECRQIEVSGGSNLFQLSNRLIVHQ